jgi:hypothetical protein
MQTTIKRLFFGLFLALLLSFGLMLCPVSAQAAVKNAPKTVLVTSPSQPQGQNDWYVSATTVKLVSLYSGRTYFQINGTDNGKWQLYTKPFRAWRGENTLYYYTVTPQGVKEDIHSQVIKVNYTKPVIKDLVVKSVNAQAEVSWANQTNVSKYNVYKHVDGQYRFIGFTTANSYIDTHVAVGKSYIYQVAAVDSAGLKSKKMTTTITIKAATAGPLPVLVPSVSSATVQSTPSAPTVSNLTKQKIKTPVKKNTEINSSDLTIKTEAQPKAKTQPVRDWNRLLVAISILVIAVVAAVCAYYLYAWWLSRQDVKEEKPKEKKTNSRW